MQPARDCRGSRRPRLDDRGRDDRRRRSHVRRSQPTLGHTGASAIATIKGYGGRILFVDVTDGSSRIVPLSEADARALLGGNGLAARILLDHVPAGIDAFDPRNAVIFAVGPITDTTVPGNSRACVVSKSPLTGPPAQAEPAAEAATNPKRHRAQPPWILLVAMSRLP